MHLELEQELKNIKNQRTLIRTAQSDNISTDLKTQLFGKKLTPWTEKAKAIREELEKSDIIRDALESAQAEIKYKQKELLLEKSATQQIKSRLDVVKLELAKQQTLNKDLVHFELEAKDAESKLSKFVAKSKELEKKQEKLLREKSELQSTVNSYQNTLKEMKKKMKQKKIKGIHDDEDDHPPTMRRSGSITNIHNGRGKQGGHRRSSSISHQGSFTDVFRNGKFPEFGM